MCSLAFAGQGALTLYLLCSHPSAYTEPYKVCPISAAAPKEDLSSDEEQGSSEEEDGTPRDPSLTHKVGPRGCGGGQRCEGLERGGKGSTAPPLGEEVAVCK